MDEGLPPAGATMRVRALRRQYRLARNGYRGAVAGGGLSPGGAVRKRRYGNRDEPTIREHGAASAAGDACAAGRDRPDVRPGAGHDDREHPGRGHRSGRTAGPRRRRHRRRGGRRDDRRRVHGRRGSGRAARPEPVRPLRGDGGAGRLPDEPAGRRAGPRGPDRVAGDGSGRRQRERDGRGDRRAAGGRRDQRGRRRGHHPRPDRGGPHRPQLPELPATGARGAARRPGVARQPGVQVRPELPRHRRRRGRLTRQLLLHRRHQRHRRGQRHVRRQPQHRDHPGAAGADRGHPGRVRRRPRAAVERRHQVGHQPAPSRAARGTTRGWSSPSASGCGATGRRSPRTPTATPPATPTPIRTPTSRAT